MEAETSSMRKCAVCGLIGLESTDWFKADVSSGRMLLNHAGESYEDSSSELYLCSQEHAGQFLVAWLFCDDSHGNSLMLPRSNDFRLRSTDPAMEFSLTMAIQAFWEEGIRVTEGRSLRQCINI